MTLLAGGFSEGAIVTGGDGLSDAEKLQIEQNKQGIASNGLRITTNQTNNTNTEAKAEQNKQEIQSVKTDIATNKTAGEQNKAKTESNLTEITANKTEIENIKKNGNHHSCTETVSADPADSKTILKVNISTKEKIRGTLEYSNDNDNKRIEIPIIIDKPNEKMILTSRDDKSYKFIIGLSELYEIYEANLGAGADTEIYIVPTKNKASAEWVAWLARYTEILGDYNRITINSESAITCERKTKAETNTGTMKQMDTELDNAVIGINNITQEIKTTLEQTEANRHELEEVEETLGTVKIIEHDYEKIGTETGEIINGYLTGIGLFTEYAEIRKVIKEGIKAEYANEWETYEGKKIYAIEGIPTEKEPLFNDFFYDILTKDGGDFKIDNTLKTQKIRVVIEQTTATTQAIYIGRENGEGTKWKKTEHSTVTENFSQSPETIQDETKFKILFTTNKVINIPICLSENKITKGISARQLSDELKDDLGLGTYKDVTHIGTLVYNGGTNNFEITRGNHFTAIETTATNTGYKIKLTQKAIIKSGTIHIKHNPSIAVGGTDVVTDIALENGTIIKPNTNTHKTENYDKKIYHKENVSDVIVQENDGHISKIKGTGSTPKVSWTTTLELEQDSKSCIYKSKARNETSFPLAFETTKGYYENTFPLQYNTFTYMLYTTTGQLQIQNGYIITITGSNIDEKTN